LRHRTEWTCSNCPCVIIVAWDADQTEDVREHRGVDGKPCPRHAHLSHADRYPVLLAESAAASRAAADAAAGDDLLPG
jgi:hypothetical protein